MLAPHMTAGVQDMEEVVLVDILVQAEWGAGTSTVGSLELVDQVEVEERLVLLR